MTQGTCSIIDVLPRQEMDYWKSLSYIGTQIMGKPIGTIFCLDLNKYLIIDGHTRYYAHLLARKKRIKVNCHRFIPFLRAYKNGKPKINWDSVIDKSQLPRNKITGLVSDDSQRKS